MRPFVQLQAVKKTYIKQGKERETVPDSVNRDIAVLSTGHDGFYDFLIGSNERQVWNGSSLSRHRSIITLQYPDSN